MPNDDFGRIDVHPNGDGAATETASSIADDDELQSILEKDPARLSTLATWILVEIVDAIAARGPMEALWREMLRLYDGVSKNPVRNTPVENAPNIEVTLGAIASDAIYAQMLELIFQISPLVTVRATQKSWVPHAAALQTFVDHMASVELNLREAVENVLLDDCQLGSGVYYCPWRDEVKKTVASDVRWSSPDVLPVPIEDFLVPGASYGNLQRTRWCAMRSWLTEEELNLRAERDDWRVSGAQPAPTRDWNRIRRETLGRTSLQIQRRGLLYEIWDVYIFYDIDRDGLDEDLLIHWDRWGQQILKIRFNPYDCRPFEAMRYQRRAHLFYGMGVMEMIRPYQEEMTELHNQQLTNVQLANCRLWKSRSGSIPDGQLVIWPNRNVELPDPNDLQGEQLADVYPSIFQSQSLVVSLAERRVGVNDLSTPRPSAVMGSRTPGITALSMLQQANRRFTPAFDGARNATSGAVKQGLFRYRERLLDPRTTDEVSEHIRDVCGEEEGTLVIELLMSPKFGRAVMVELTASSSSTNRDSDRQNAILLVNLLGSYYEKTLQLVAIAANPQTPEVVREVARKISNSAGEIIERTIRTFDQVRDPESFLVSIDTELDKLEGLSQEGLLALNNMVQQGAGLLGASGLMERAAAPTGQVMPQQVGP